MAEFPHYNLIPKDYESNLKWRREMLETAAVDKELAASLRQMCAEDCLFYINAFCLAEGTPVVTDRGLVPIESVCLEDKVWDGKSWVSQDGPLCKGRKSVMFGYGIHLTPEHEVLTDHGWQKAIHRYDRVEVRLPRGYSARRAVSKLNKSRVVVPMRIMRFRESCRRQHSSPRQGAPMCLREQRESHTRTSKEQDLLCVAVNESSMQKPKRGGGSTLGSFREFSEGHGGRAGRNDDRSDRQQRGLHKAELSMGDSERAGKQHPSECLHRDISWQALTGRGRKNRGNNLLCNAETKAVRHYWRRSDSSKIHKTACVYDLLNCGPNQAFAVIGEDGPVLVHNCFTYDPRDTVTPNRPFITYPFQDKAINSAIDAIVEGFDLAWPKSRTMGASWMGIVVFEWFWHFQENLSFLFISRNSDYVDLTGNSKTLFSKVDYLHQHQPRWLLPTGRHLGNKDPNRRLLHLGNADTGSVIDGETTTADAGRGDRRTAMFIDEFAAFDTKDGFQVLKASQHTTNCRFFNSTPQGAFNAFHKVVYKTSAQVFRMHWSEHPIYNKGLYTSVKTRNRYEVQILDKECHEKVTTMRKTWKKRQKFNFPEDYPFILDGKMRSPWYDKECSRCATLQEIAQELDINFLGSSFQFFEPEFIQILMREYCIPHIMRGKLIYNLSTLEVDGFELDDYGPLFLWFNLPGDGSFLFDKSPLQGRRYGLGSDVSHGTGASNSATAVVDLTTGRKVALWKSPHVDPITFADETIALAKWFNNGFMAWDASGPPGKTFTNRVIEQKYFKIYYRRDEGHIRERMSDQPGFFLNPVDRSVLMHDYRTKLEERRYINPSESGMREALEFIVEPGGRVVHSAAAYGQDPTGARDAHGDEVIADAIASRLLSVQSNTLSVSKPKAPWMSPAWRIEKEENAIVEAEREDW